MSYRADREKKLSDDVKNNTAVATADSDNNRALVVRQLPTVQ